jgi:hypothetical protein
VGETVAETPPGAVQEGPWIERLARFGLASKALLYAVVGLLAATVAIGDRGGSADREGALRAIARQPLGEWLLFVMAVGFCGYATWRLAQAVLDRDARGDGPQGLAIRAGKLGSAAIYIGFAALALWLVISEDEDEAGGNVTGDATGGVFGWPGGRWLVLAAGVAVIGVGAWNVHRGLARDFVGKLRLNRMSVAQRRAAAGIGLVGLCARGLVFGLVGAFLIKAAVEFDASQAVGLDGALARLAGGRWGPYLLLAAAAGLIAYATLSAVEARWKDATRRRRRPRP